MKNNPVTNVINKIHEAQSIISYLSTGFIPLDKRLLGYQKGDLITIAGMSNFDKTAFAISAIVEALKDKKKVKYFLMGEDPKVFVSRIVCHMHNLYLTDFLLGEFDKSKKDIVIESLHLIDEYLNIESSLYCDEIYLIENIESSNGFDLIVIDNLQFIEIQDNYKVNLIKDLKRLAVKAEAPIILLSEVDPNSENRIDPRPIATDIIESNNVFTYSDKVLAIYSDETNKERREYIKELESKSQPTGMVYKSAYIDRPIIDMEILVLKNSLGKLDNAKVEFDKQIGKFKNKILKV